MSKEYNVAILGATGAVGTRMIQQLEQSTIPVKSVKLLASAKSAGKQLSFKGQPITVEETTPDSCAFICWWISIKKVPSRSSKTGSSLC